MIIDNVLDIVKQEEIKSLVSALDFPWYWRDGLIIFDRADPTNIVGRYPNAENPMFMHQITKLKEIMNKPLYDNMVVPIILAFQEKTGMRVRAVRRSQINLVPRMTLSDAEYSASLHRDMQLDDPVNLDKFITLLYYPLTSDGPTITYYDDGEDLNILESCDPVQGRLFWYKSSTLHRLTVPKTSPRRISININVEIH